MQDAGVAFVGLIGIMLIVALAIAISLASVMGILYLGLILTGVVNLSFVHLLWVAVTTDVLLTINNAGLRKQITGHAFKIQA